MTWISRSVRATLHLKIGSLISIAILTGSCTYMKMDPAGDADKAFLAGNNSCYLATAANMLAGSGYGNGNTIQDRADDIYGDLVAQFGTANGGWTDTALSWWLSSNNNVWPNNPYTVVTVYGNKSPKFPWANPNGAQFIANELRRCHFVGLSISWPTNAQGVVGSGGHAITGWGDQSWWPFRGYNDPLTYNPNRVRVSDSDRDTGGDVQSYNYDTYTSPNPGGPNEGSGWYFDYDNNHPYIKHIITLTSALTPSGTEKAVRVVGSYKIHQDRAIDATDLHYNVGTDTDILSYLTRVSWTTQLSPEIKENEPRRDQLEVEWDFSEKPVPQSTWVTITTDFILRAWNAIKYDDVKFTYPKGISEAKPFIGWKMVSPTIKNAETIPNVTGGYVIGSFDVIDPAAQNSARLVGEYRFIHQYSYTESPEQHTLEIAGPKGFQITNLRFGHSYGFLDPESLWTFFHWMTEFPGKTYALGEKPVEIKIDWNGRLPYPEGEDIKGRLPNIKDDPSSYFQFLRKKR